MRPEIVNRPMVLKAESAKTAAPMRPMSCDPDFDPNCEDPLNDPPASDPGGPYTGQVGQSVQFDGSGSWDPDGSIVSYLWNFGDGGTSTSVTPQHAYAAAGTYNVSLRVRDNDLVYNTAYTTATISAAPTPTPTPTPTPNPNVSWEQTFLYDRYGNRTFDAANTTTIAGCGATICNPTISTANNRISTGQGYSYDANGAVTQDAAGQRFGYDAEGRQTQFFSANNATQTPDATYSFDGDGKRVKKTSATENTTFVYDASGQLVEEYASGTVQTSYVYAGSSLLTTETAGGTNYLTADHLGSPRIVTDASGNVTSRKDYTAFGEETTTAQRTTGLGYNPQNVRQDYTGYQKDNESGLEYAQARYYNPLHGRFTSVDPLAASATIRDPQTFNRYSYALNSPYKFSDPLGLMYISSGPNSSYGGPGFYGCSAEFDSCGDSDTWSAPLEIPESHTNESAEPPTNPHDEPHSGSHQEVDPPASLKAIVIIFYGGGLSGSDNGGQVVVIVQPGSDTSGLGEAKLGFESSILAYKIKTDFPDAQVILAGPDALDTVYKEVHDRAPENILIAGYSRGGYAAVELANTLVSKGYDVNQVTTVDPSDMAITRPGLEQVGAHIGSAVNYWADDYQGRKVVGAGVTNIQLTENDRQKSSTEFSHINMMDIASPKVLQRIEGSLREIYK